MDNVFNIKWVFGNNIFVSNRITLFPMYNFVSNLNSMFPIHFFYSNQLRLFPTDFYVSSLQFFKCMLPNYIWPILTIYVHVRGQIGLGGQVRTKPWILRIQFAIQFRLLRKTLRFDPIPKSWKLFFDKRWTSLLRFTFRR